MIGTRPGQHHDVVGVAAGRGDLGLDVGVELLGLLQGLVGDEDRLGVLGRERPALLGGAGLHEQRVALDRPRHVERPGHAEVRAHVVDGAQPGRVAPHAGLLVTDLVVVGPGVPQLRGDVEELVGPLVAGRLERPVRQREVGGLLLGGGGDDVPAGAPAGDVVDGGEAAGQRVGLVVRRGGRRDQADAAGGARHRGEQGERLQLAGGTELSGADRDLAVGEEDRVELRVLGQLGQTDVVAGVERGQGVGLGQSPRGLVVAGVHEEGVEVELSGHVGTPQAVVRAWWVNRDSGRGRP